MRERKGGRLLFVSSALGRFVVSGNAAYASTKWALEALAESIAIETSQFGIATTLIQPGTVSSSALDNPAYFRLPNDPYAGTLAIDTTDGGGPITITPEFVATAIADTAELDTPPLRVPVGEQAKYALAARKAAPEDVPFTLG